jgi:hypothetical protein
MSYFDDASLVMIPSGYKASKVYSVKPTDGTGDLTFTRSNDTATRVGPDGLIEKVRTNLVRYSQDFNNAAWVKVVSTSITASGVTDPNGGTTAVTVSFPNSTSEIYQSLGSLTGSYTDSIYVKGTAGETIALWGVPSYQLFTLTGEWQRISKSNTLSGSTGYLALGRSGTAATATSVSIAFAQFETGDIATDYIATTSAAVSVGPVANVPRLDYLGSSCPRLLLEPQRTNLLTYSEQFDNAAWSKSAVTITANDITSPDGYTNADKMVESATTSGHYILQSPTLTAAAYTFTIFAKAGERNWFLFRQHTLGLNASFNLATGTLGTIAAGLTATIEDYGNDWYRCSVTFTGTAAAHSFRLYVTTADNSTSSYLGDGTSGLYLYGAGCELGSYPTSYIPTLGSASTRGSDAAYKTGISSLIGSVGTLFVQMKALENGNTSRRISLSDGTLDNRVTIEYDEIASRIRGFIIGAGVASSNLDADGYNQTDLHKIAVVYNNATLKIFIDGVLANSITATMVPTGMDRITTFTASSSSNYLFAELNQLLLFTTALSDADAIALTA